MGRNRLFLWSSWKCPRQSLSGSHFRSWLDHLLSSRPTVGNQRAWALATPTFHPCSVGETWKRSCLFDDDASETVDDENNRAVSVLLWYMNGDVNIPSHSPSTANKPGERLQSYGLGLTSSSLSFLRNLIRLSACSRTPAGEMAPMARAS